MKHITMFDKPYSKEKQAEGIGVSQAVVFGECDRCAHLSACSSNEAFEFPSNAACMKRKAKIMKEWQS